MTLIVAIANWEHAVQVSDRRITANGVPVSDAEGKAIHLHLPHADLLVGYTGLARVGSQPMSQILMEIMLRSAEKADFIADATVHAIGEELTSLFKTPKVRAYAAKHRRLSVMFTGFNYFEGDSGLARHQIAHALLTNFQRWGEGDNPEAWDEFKPLFFNVKDGETWPTVVQRIGAWAAVPLDFAEDLRALLAEGKPASAVRDKVVSMLPGWSTAYSVIGKEANCAVLRPRAGVEWTHASSTSAWVVNLGSTVIALPGQMVALMDAQIEAVDKSTSPMIVPQVPRRNPCPCGSGLRYRQCHGKKV